MHAEVRQTRPQGTLGRLKSEFSENPIQCSALCLMGAMGAFIVANALFFQHGSHPAPLYSGLNTNQVASIEETITSNDDAEIFAVSQQTARPVAATEVVTATVPVPALRHTENQHQQQRQQLRVIQNGLMQMGLYAGSIDGLYGPRTASAIKSFEARMGLPVTGAPSQQLIGYINKQMMSENNNTIVTENLPVQKQEAHAQLQTLQSQHQMTVPKPALSGQRNHIRKVATQEQRPVNNKHRQLIKMVQEGLSRLGYQPGSIDGFMGSSTHDAIRRFELDRKMNITGGISEALVLELVRMGGIKAI